MNKSFLNFLFQGKKLEEKQDLSQYYERLIEIGFFDFETAESMLTPDFFQSMKKMKVRELVSILKELSKLEQTDNVRILQNRILNVLSAITFWIDERNLLSFIRNKE